MMLSQNIRATRVKGSLEVELEDGRTGTLQVDLDTSGPGTAWGVEHEYIERESSLLYVSRVISTKFYVSVPPNLNQDAPFVLEIPISDAEV